MPIGVWRTRGFTAADAANDCVSLAPQLFVSEAEIPAFQGSGAPNPQAQNWPILVAALAPFGIDCAVATTWTPFQGPDGKPMQELADPLIEAGWYVLPYVYPAENVGASVANALAYAQHYGPVWANAEPVLGLYGGYTIDDPAFAGIEDVAGFSVWDAGTIGL